MSRFSFITLPILFSFFANFAAGQEQLQCDNDESPFFSVSDEQNNQALLCLSRADTFPYPDVTITAKVLNHNEAEPRIYRLRGVFSSEEGELVRKEGVKETLQNLKNLLADQLGGENRVDPISINIDAKMPTMEEIEENPGLPIKIILRIGEQEWQKSMSNFEMEVRNSTCYLADRILSIAALNTLIDFVSHAGPAE